MKTLSKNKWLIAFGGLMLISAVVVVVSDFVGWAIVEKHNPISETISKLAVGDYGWIMDVGLDCFAAGVAGVGIGFLLWERAAWQWSVGGVLLLIIAVVVLGISEFDQYKGFDDFGGKVHTWLCYALFGSVTAAVCVIGWKLRAIDDNYFRLSVAFLLIWIVGGPFFMLAAPDSVDGAFERGLASTLVFWMCMLGWLHIKAGRSALGSDRERLNSRTSEVS